MDYQLYPIIACLTAIPLGVTIILLWGRQQLPVARKLLTLLGAVFGWLLFNTLELVDPTPAGTLLWAKISYLFIASMPVFWLLFAVEYHDRASWLRPPRLALLWIIPAVCVALALTNERHGLIWQSTSFAPVGQYLALQVTYGPFFWVNWGYDLLLLLIGSVVLIRDNLAAYRVYRGQVLWITLGLLIVIGFNLVYGGRLFPGLHKDYTPVAMAFSVLCFAVAVMRYRLLDLTSLNRSAFFDSIDAGVLAADLAGRVIDLNPAARRLFDLFDAELTGRPLHDIFPQEKTLIDSLSGPGEQQAEVLAHAEPLLYLDIKASPLFDQQKRLRGRLFQIRDITRYKLIEIAEHENRELAEALSSTAATLNSSLDIEEVLDQILANVKRVLPCDTANLMLIEHGIARTVRRMGSNSLEVSLKVAETPNMRWMMEHHQPIIIPDVETWPGWIPRPSSDWICSYAGAPIVVEGETIGFINLDSSICGFYNQVHVERLQAFANQAATAMQNARLFSRVAQLATLDELTGLNNRRFFFNQAARDVSRALRYAAPLAVVMVDLDHFKGINDTFGHAIGDRVLEKVGEVIRAGLREEDLNGRYGGEEFVILLPETDFTGAMEAAERLRLGIRQMELETPNGMVRVTASLGVAQLFPGCMTLEDLLNQADQALYLAKQNGRDRVEAAH